MDDVVILRGSGAVWLIQVPSAVVAALRRTLELAVPIPTLARMGEYGADLNVLLSILRFTAVFDFSGSPTITLPNGTASNRMPLGVQLVGRHLSADLLTPAAHAFQSTTDWHTRRAPVE